MTWGIWDFFSEEAVGITALYNYGTWLVMVTDWCLHYYGGDSWKLNRNSLGLIYSERSRSHLVRPFWLEIWVEVLI